MLSRFQGIVRERRALRVTLLALYYALIVAGLVLLYGRGDFSAQPYIYQGF
jgi:hypothetical protein